MTISTATDVAKLALVGGVLYVGYRAITALGEVPTPTETVNEFATSNAFWSGTSVGQTFSGMLDWYTNGWGITPFTPEEAAAASQAADDANAAVGWDDWTWRGL